MKQSMYGRRDIFPDLGRRAKEARLGRHKTKGSCQSGKFINLKGRSLLRKK